MGRLKNAELYKSEEEVEMVLRSAVKRIKEKARVTLDFLLSGQWTYVMFPFAVK